MPDETPSPLAEYLTDAEEIVTTHRDAGRTVAVTDERLVQVTRKEHGNDRGETNTRALLLAGPAVRGTDVTVRDPEEPDLGSLAAAAVFGVMGFGLLFFGLDALGPGQEILALVATLPGILLMLVGLAIGVKAFDTDDGGVEVTVLGESDESVVLPRSAEDVATAATRVVAEQA